MLPITADCQENPAIAAGKEIAVVTTAYGKVRGYIHTGIYTFKGIPYGTAKRFMPPEKAASWEGIRSSMTFGPTCPSPESYVFRDEYEFPLNRSHGYYIKENCLNLNIWSKEVNGAERKPVMVYLHGGGFSSGSSVEFSSLDGENLSRKGDVVVVSINHRLNTLGFLDLSAYGDKYKPLVIKQANQKSKTSHAPVYVYLFAWQSPVLDGTYKAFHTMDLPFVFNNIARCEEMTGGGQRAYQMADKMSAAWIQFARTGNPNCKEIPDWPNYTSIN